MTTAEPVREFVGIARLALEGAEEAGDGNFGYALARLRTLRDKISEATEAVHAAIESRAAPKVPTSAPEERSP